MEYIDPGTITFEAVIMVDANSGGNYIEFPHDVKTLFGTKARIPAQATFDNIPYRGSMSNMGTGKHVLIIVRDIRNRIAKQAGDAVSVSVELDKEPRAAEIPPDLAAGLKENTVAGQNFSRLAYSHQRDYVTLIADSKKPETRDRRINKALEMLSKGMHLK